MEKYIPLDAVLAEIDKRIKNNILLQQKPEISDFHSEIQQRIDCLKSIRGYILNTLEAKEVKEPASTSYVVTRCEEHSDYVEKVFFDEDKAHEYCDQFKGNENEYARHITKVEVTL